ncbi:MAG TPA: ATP-dependent DNA ligase [Gemmatimonadaceae bacterium]|nr:ATP-dependent DNA ligase [Gemmatimonadaceae bacterium]
MRLAELVDVSASVAATSGRLQKIAQLASLLSRLSPEEVPIAVGFLIGWPRQGKIGIGWSTISSARADAAASVRPDPTSPIAHPPLEMNDVDAAFSALTKIRGKNSAAERVRLLGELFSRASSAEQNFLGGLLVGEVRQGALEGVMLEAVAKASGIPADKVRRAAMMAGDLGIVAQAALGEDRDEALAKYQLEVFRPVQPMLADSASDIPEAFSQGGPFAVEWKLDGARIQVHRRDDRVAVYTRSLNEVTNAVPEVVAAVRALPGREIILDGEVIALAPDGRPLTFQDTMRRFGRRMNVEKLRDELPLTPFFFDVLLHDGESLIDHPLSQRLERLDQVASSALRVPRIVTADTGEAQSFQADALARGHEGVMVKLYSAPYAAGRRGSAWIKVKTARTLDLVVLAVEWGSGRRQGWLSNIHLGARDPINGGFVMLGKTFKGMTDEMLEWQTKEFLEREVSREGHIVHVRPELVVEVAFNEVQKSPHYPGGVALRFARVKGYRPDKKPSEADTIDTVRTYLPEGQG